MEEFKKRKVILFFTDCEGTIAKEGSYDYDQAKMFKLFDELAKLEKITGAEIKLHLISPTSHKQMAEFIKRLEEDIKTHYTQNRSKDDNAVLACDIEEAGAYYEYGNLGSELQGNDEYYSRVSNLNIPEGRNISEGQINSAKEDYVKLWYDYYANSDLKDILFAIYAGNGNIDLRAINFINSQKNGYSICPSNSPKSIRSIANFASDKRCIEGVIEGISELNLQLEKRQELARKNKDSKKISEEELEF